MKPSVRTCSSKPKLRGAARVELWVRESKCTVVVTKRVVGQFIDIWFHGKLAAIPSLKNSKIPGTNFINPDVRARLDAMTRLFHDVTKLNAPAAYGSDRVWCVVILGSACRVRDDNNAFTAVADWLEPKTKANRNKPRGWGVGLVDDDAQVKGFAIKAKDLNRNERDTHIRICPWAAVQPDLTAWVARTVL